MDWVKKNYDKLALLLLALLLLAMSGMLVLNAMHFNETFAGIQGQVTKKHEPPPVDMSGLERANAEIEKSANWAAHKGSIFVSEPYLVTGNPPHLVSPTGPGSEPLHPPVPNQWFVDHGLNLLDPNVLNEDADGDGFTNLEEWKGLKGDGSDSTDPQNKDSHPPFYLKLRVARVIQVPFRVRFNGYDGDPKKPESLSFQINTKDPKPSTQFLKLNEPIAGTKYKVQKFEYKQALNPSTGENTDVSELTIENTETGEPVVLPLDKEVNSPDSYAVLRSLIDNKDYNVKKNRTFVLALDNTEYKLIDIKDGEALIESTKNPGQTIRVPKLEPL